MNRENLQKRKMPYRVLFINYINQKKKCMTDELTLHQPLFDQSLINAINASRTERGQRVYQIFELTNDISLDAWRKMPPTEALTHAKIYLRDEVIERSAKQLSTNEFPFFEWPNHG